MSRDRLRHFPSSWKLDGLGRNTLHILETTVIPVQRQPGPALRELSNVDTRPVRVSVLGMGQRSQTAAQPSGYDMVIGQNANPTAGRARSCTILGRDASPATIVTMSDFVIASGEGYFFSPSISALKTVLGAELTTKPDCHLSGRIPECINPPGSHFCRTALSRGGFPAK